MSKTVFPPKRPDERKTYTFDFTSQLSSSETISAAATTATVYSGTDPSPQTIVYASATISGQTVTQKIAGGTLGVIYQVVCAITTSSSQVLQMTGLIAIVGETD
jgi:hypothetical protein